MARRNILGTGMQFVSSGSSIISSVQGQEDASHDEEDASSRKYEIVAPKHRASKQKTAVAGDRMGGDQEEGEEEEESMAAMMERRRRKRRREKKEVGGEKNKKNKRKEEGGEKEQYVKDRDFGSFLEGNVGRNVVNMMRRMGYDFQSGMGKHGEGIVNPIKVVQQTSDKKLGVMTSDLHDLEQMQMQEEEERRQEINRQQEHAWKKDARKRKPKKPSVVYKSAEELIKEQELQKQQRRSGASVAQQGEIVDMRGPEVRVFSSFDELKTATGISATASGKSQLIHELQYNIRQLVLSTEKTVQEVDQRKKHEVDRIVRMRREKARLEEQVAQQKKSIGHFREVLSALRQCSERINQSKENGAMSLEQMGAVFDALHFKYPDIYMQYDISKCAASLAAPLIKHAFRAEEWNPLQQPRFKFDLLQQWKRILSTGEAKQSQIRHDGMDMREESDDHDTAFSLLVEDLILPKIRRVLQNEWQVRDSESAVRLIETWKSMLPYSMLQHITNSIILPKIIRAVEQEWQPEKELLHMWIHPWLPILGDQMDTRGLYDTIRQKFASALQTWQPDDPSAYAVLLPWKDVFGKRIMDRFLVKHVLPKLETVLSDQFEVDPSNQDIMPFVMITQWHDLLSDKYMIPLLERHFFTKWNYVLYQWLTSPSPDYSQINAWYLGWKSVFPPELVNRHKRMQRQFNRALDMINQALSNQPISMPSSDSEHESEEAQHFQRQLQQQKKSRTDASTTASAAPPGQPSFKELVEHYALKKDILFAPRVGQTHEGKQIYDFGRVPIFIKEDCVYAKQPRASGPTKFSLVTAEQLIQLVQMR